MAKKGTKASNGQSTLATPAESHELEVKFGGLSIGESTARLGVSIGRGAITLAKAAKLLCERRLIGSIELGSSQGELPGMESDTYRIEGAFDTRALGVKQNDYRTGLTMALGEIDVSDLAHFPKRNGRLLITDVQAIPEKPKSSSNWDAEEDGDDEPMPDEDGTIFDKAD